MYLMFVTVNGKLQNTMGIKGTWTELLEEQTKLAREAFGKDPHATFEAKFIPFN